MSARNLVKRAFFSAARYSGTNFMLRSIHGRRGVLGLCYHGVVGEVHTATDFLYRNTVSVTEFRSHLEFLTRHFHPISASELVSFWHSGQALKPRSVLVTFDDGYRNNLTQAAPILMNYGVPALFSVTTGYIGSTDVLWPDEVNLRVLSWPRATIPGPSLTGPVWLPVPDDHAGRIGLAERIRAACKSLPSEISSAYLSSLREISCKTIDDRDHELFEFLSWDDVRSLSNKGFEIGSHTVSHPILTQISTDRLEFELSESKRRIEEELQEGCVAFVYPNGQAEDISSEVVAAVQRAGYLLGLSNTGSYASFSGNRFCLSRIGVPGHQPRIIFECRTSGLHTWAKNFL